MEKLVPKLRFPEFEGEWKKIQLGKFSEINPKNGVLPDSFIYIDLESVNNGILEQENLISKVDAPSRAQRILKKDDILYQTVRPYQKNNLYFDKKIGNYIASTGYAQLRTKYSSKFLYQLLHTDKFVSKVLLRCTGTSYPSINSSDLSEIIISYPQPEEQQKIATFLTSVDERIALLEKQKQGLETYKKGVMQQIFSQQLRFKPDPNETSGDDKGKDFPDWEEKKLGEVIKVVVGGTPSTTNEEFWDGNIGWIGSGELKNNIIKKPTKYITELGLKKSSTYLMPKHTVVLAMTGATLGKIGILDFECTGNQSVAGFLPSEAFDNFFLFYKLQSMTNQILSFAGGAAQAGINKKNIESLEIDLPSLKEQQKIASFLSVIDERIEVVSKQIEQSKVFKKGLLQQMFV